MHPLLPHISHRSILLLDVSLSVALTIKFVLLMLTFISLLSRLAFHKLNFLCKSFINLLACTRPSTITANKSSDKIEPLCTLTFTNCSDNFHSIISNFYTRIIGCAKSAKRKFWPFGKTMLFCFHANQ